MASPYWGLTQMGLGENEQWGLTQMGLGENAVHIFIVNSSNTDLNSAWMCMGLRSVFDESTIVSV